MSAPTKRDISPPLSLHGNSTNLILSSPLSVQSTSMPREMCSGSCSSSGAVVSRSVQSVAVPVPGPPPPSTQVAQQLVLRRDFTVRTPLLQRAQVWNTIAAESKNAIVINELDTLKTSSLDRVNLSSGGQRIMNTPNVRADQKNFRPID
jgi:hypothetical protein